MFQRVLSFGGTLLLAGVVVLATTDPGQARGPGGARFGGAHFGGARFFGYHPGFYRGGYPFRPYSWYHNYPYYGYYPYSYAYPYGYGYGPSFSGYDPYGYGYSPYDSPSADDSSWYPGFGEAYSPGANAGGFTPVSPLSGDSQGLTRPGQPDTTAHVTVRVPAGADVWINGSNTDSAGPVREFRSGPLTPGQQYTYEFRARWKDDDGREVTQTQQVAVTAGNHARVDFPVPPGTGAQAAITKRP